MTFKDTKLRTKPALLDKVGIRGLEYRENPLEEAAGWCFRALFLRY